MKTTTINISGMGCSGCANTVESALSNLKGVESVTVNLEEGTADVSYEGSEVQPENFNKAISDAGYEMTGVKA